MLTWFIVPYWLPLDITGSFVFNAHQYREQHKLLNPSLHTCPSIQRWLPVAKRKAPELLQFGERVIFKLWVCVEIKLSCFHDLL